MDLSFLSASILNFPLQVCSLPLWLETKFQLLIIIETKLISMLAVKLTGLEEMEIVEVDKPSGISPDEVLLKIKYVGVCGSDIHYYNEGKIGTQVVEYPFMVGHECSGQVVAKGENVSHLEEGDLVVIDPSVHCGHCGQCLSGRPHTCLNNKFLGCPGQLEGCLTEYIVMPAFTCFPVNDLMDAEEAALLEPFTIGVYSVKQANIVSPDTSIAIFGAGPIGLSILMRLLAGNFTRTGVIEPLGYRLEKAGEIGAAWLVNPVSEKVETLVKSHVPELVDVVFDASGEQQAIDDALAILKPGGKLVLVGIPPSGQYTINMDLARRKEITLVNVRRQNHCVEEAIQLVASGKVNLKQMVTHYFQLRKTPVAFDMVAGYRDNVIKAMIVI
jgi:L-iditol 2-dehydrogenase